MTLEGHLAINRELVFLLPPDRKLEISCSKRESGLIAELVEDWIFPASKLWVAYSSSGQIPHSSTTTAVCQVPHSLILDPLNSSPPDPGRGERCLRPAGPSVHGLPGQHLPARHHARGHVLHQGDRGRVGVGVPAARGPAPQPGICGPEECRRPAT